MYFYDAFGRRIAKSSSVKQSSKLGLRGNVPRFGFVSYEKPQRQTMLMLWDGNRQVQEYTTDHVFTTVYEQDSFVPVARLVWLQPHLQEQAKIAEDKQWQELEHYVIPKHQKQRLEHQTQVGVRIYHYHNDHLGTPQELTNALGEVVWLNYSQAWGGSYETKCFAKELDNLDVSADLLQPIRFQGQFFDIETNLHYNRFRYYDSDVGMFISRDPIELLGGINNFAYAPNPIEWIDPSGLLVTPTYTRGKNLRVERVQATILKADLNSGTSTNASSRLEAQKMGNCSKWHAGHLLAKRLGGSGGVGHIFPQTPNINTGAYRVFEGKVYDAVNLHGSASVDIQFKYPNVKSKVPNLIIYSYTSGGKSIEQEFLNPSPCT